MLTAGQQLDFVFIDGWTTFAYLVYELFIINRMLAVGGAIMFDDSYLLCIGKAIAVLKSHYGYREIEYGQYGQTFRLLLFHILPGHILPGADCVGRIALYGRCSQRKTKHRPVIGRSTAGSDPGGRSRPPDREHHVYQFHHIREDSFEMALRHDRQPKLRTNTSDYADALTG